jgi:hypothetical protein
MLGPVGPRSEQFTLQENQQQLKKVTRFAACWWPIGLGVLAYQYGMSGERQ